MSFPKVKKIFHIQEEKIKNVDFHLKLPWLLCTCHTGKVDIWNYENHQLIETLKMPTTSIKAAKFILHKNWIISACDDRTMKIYDYDTKNIVSSFESGDDMILSITMHLTRRIFLTITHYIPLRKFITLWNWESGDPEERFEGHTNCVTQAVFHPKETDILASSSLDATIKIWKIGSRDAICTLQGHEDGINSIAFHIEDNKPYIVSGSDDFTIKIWNYKERTCISTLSGHRYIVTTVAVHPNLRIILTGSEDKTVKIWNLNTNELQMTLEYNLEQVNTIESCKGTNKVAIGFDLGLILLEIDPDLRTSSCTIF